MTPREHLGPIVSEWTGIEISRGGISRSLDEYLRRRLSELGVSPLEYGKQLTPDGSEFQNLIDVITVTYTWFFRDVAQLNAISQLMSDLATSSRPLRIWVPGCASGEDAYSVALLAARLGKPVEVLGTDLNTQALAQARRGQYSAWSIRDVPEDLRREFTAKSDGRFKLSERIRSSVRFERHNLVDAPPTASTGSGWDVILCRNVFIYFLRERVISVIRGLTQALCPGGHLLIGAGEIVVDPPAQLEPTYVQGRLLFRRRLAGAESQRPQHSADGRKPHKRHSHRPARAQSSASSVLALPLAHKAATPAAAPFVSLPLDSSLGSELHHAHGLLERGELEAALSAYNKAVERDPSHSEPRMFAGIAHYLSGDLERARHELRAALFLDSEAWLAAFYLASCHETMGYAEEARRDYLHAAHIGERARENARHPLAAWQSELIDLARRRSSR